MKYKIFLLFCLLNLIFLRGYSDTLTLYGTYNDKNLYIQNSFSGEGIFCIDNVIINNKTYTSTINASAFEIDFKSLKINIGGKITIKIIHKKGCVPIILNRQVINNVKDTIDVSKIKPIKKSKSELYKDYLNYIGFKTDFIKSYHPDLNELTLKRKNNEINLYDTDNLPIGLWLEDNVDNFNRNIIEYSWLEEKKLSFAKDNNFIIENEIQTKYFSDKSKPLEKKYKEKVDLEKMIIIRTEYYRIKNFKPKTPFKEQLIQPKKLAKNTTFQAGYYWKGLKVGNWTTFDADGNIKTIVEFEFGKPKGLYQVFYPSSQIKEIGFWENNRNIGEFVTYYENGNKSMQFNFNINGKRDGVSKYYYDNGIIKTIFISKNGQTNGLILDYDSLGSITNTQYCYLGNCADTIIKDSSIIELLNRYAQAENQNVKNKQEVIVLAKDIELKETKKQLYFYLLISFIGLGLLVLLFAIKTVKSKNLIFSQKILVESQKYLIEEKNKEITDSIKYAKRIQSAILPPTKLVKEYLPQSFILYKPKDIVAGDFYWMETINSDELRVMGGENPSHKTHHSPLILFAAADCTGHGVPGAMVSVVCNNGLNRSVREHGLTDPAEILNKTREIVIQEFEKSDEEVKDGMDIAVCSLSGNQLQYAGANNPLWIIRNRELLETKADKQPIGKYADLNPFTTHTFELQPNDSIYIFTDGFHDQFGGDKGKKFKASQMKELILSIQDKNMDEQKEIINNTFENWKGELDQVDDVCVIGVRV